MDNVELFHTMINKFTELNYDKDNSFDLALHIYLVAESKRGSTFIDNVPTVNWNEFAPEVTEKKEVTQLIKQEREKFYPVLKDLLENNPVLGIFLTPETKSVRSGLLVYNRNLFPSSNISKMFETLSVDRALQFLLGYPCSFERVSQYIQLQLVDGSTNEPLILLQSFVCRSRDQKLAMDDLNIRIDEWTKSLIKINPDFKIILVQNK